MDKKREDDGIWMFTREYQADIESGIDRAISQSGLSKGYYANKINQNLSKIEPYLKSSYRTPKAIALGSSGRRELIEAFCLDDLEKFPTSLN